MKKPQTYIAKFQTLNYWIKILQSLENGVDLIC